MNYVITVCLLLGEALAQKDRTGEKSKSPLEFLANESM